MTDPGRTVQTSVTDEQGSQDRALIELVRAFIRELHPQRAATMTITPASRLDRDLGIDSLGRTELILRIEHACGVRLPPATLAEAETVGDLLTAASHSATERRKLRVPLPEAPPLPDVPAPVEARTLTGALDWHVARHPDRRHVTFIEDPDTVLGTMTYAELAKAARKVAVGLIARDVMPGDSVALMLPTGLDFFASFFGALYAGAVPVPIYPPARLSQIEEHMQRQAGILRNAGARILITVPEAISIASLVRPQVESLASVETVADISSDDDVALPAVVDPDSTAFIQYTSGSTGDPKGVVLSHGNLLANIRSIGGALNATSADVFVSWLPLYHDLGLIGGWLGCLYFAAPFYVMSPLSFLSRPESWLWAIHHYRGTLSASPNFGYELCLSKLRDEDIAGLDLSSLRMVANGAEPVSIPTLRRFVARFEPYGFNPGAMAPSYGLAENTVALTMPPVGRPPLIDRVEREALSRHGVAEPAKAGDPDALEIVSCGVPIPDHEVRIVDETGREVGERHEGRLEFRGPSATSGYLRNAAKTCELFHDGWLDSGDQAYMAGGEVYVTGRVKDMIIRAGRHIYPQEVEDAIGDIAGFVKNGVAVFGSKDPASQTERVVILAETMEDDPERRRMLQARAQEAATDILGAPPDEVVLAPPQSVPKTASGKIRRSASREIYERGAVGVAPQTVRWQIARLFLASLGPRLLSTLRWSRQMAYAAWWWIVVALAASLAWLAVMILPSLALRWMAVRALARAALFAVGMRPTITGRELPDAGVVVFNHSSYADALVVAAVLPGAPAIAVKKELASQFFAGALLRRLGAHFVERYDVAGSLADAQAITDVARQKRLVVFFPEGTFSRRAGLTEFYLGAFRVAADTELPVVPGAIRGTRSMLRSDHWFPRRAPIAVHFAAPVLATGPGFAQVVRLRDEVRKAVLAGCGEPDLGGLAKPPPSPG